jgi:hypothetical protein
LYFLLLPQGQGSLRPIFFAACIFMKKNRFSYFNSVLSIAAPRASKATADEHRGMAEPGKSGPLFVYFFKSRRFSWYRLPLA